MPQLKTVFNRTMLVALCSTWCFFKYLNTYCSFLLCMEKFGLLHSYPMQETTYFYYLEWVPGVWTYCYTGSQALQILSHFIRRTTAGSRGRVECRALAQGVQGSMSSQQRRNKTEWQCLTGKAWSSALGRRLRSEVNVCAARGFLQVVWKVPADDLLSVITGSFRFVKT